MSTPDIRITLRRDVKEGNIKIENYISEFDKLKKQIDALQQAVDKMDVVKPRRDNDRLSNNETNARFQYRSWIQ